MTFLMLDLKFKNFYIISSFVRREQGVVLVEEYDKKSLYLMLVKCHEHLYPFVKSNKNYAHQDIFDQDCNLNISKQIASTSELIKELVKELLIFK